MGCDINPIYVGIAIFVILAIVGNRLGWKKIGFKLLNVFQFDLESRDASGGSAQAGSNLNPSVTVNVGMGSDVVVHSDSSEVKPEDAILVGDRLHQLPRDLAAFTDREEEVQRLGNLLRGDTSLWASIFGSWTGQSTVPALQGMGGIGKSELAVHVGRLVSDQYPDAQLVIDMRGLDDVAATSAEAMTEVIRAWFPEAQSPGIYQGVLSDKRALIILNNTRDAAQVQGLEPPQGCALIITSRRPIVLSGLEGIPLDELSEDESLRLLWAIMANRVESDDDMKGLASQCSYLPLGLRAAGTYLAGYPAHTVKTYVRELANEGSRLQALDRENWQVEATLALSAAQIARENTALAAKWQMLTVFAAPFTLSAATQVLDTTPEQAEQDLSYLENRTLLLHDPQTGRFRLLRRRVARRPQRLRLQWC